MSLPPACAVETGGLTKRFNRPVVDNLDLRVRVGEFYALLGPNGAGKTTTLKMVVGLLKPDAGSISILGIDALADPVAAKRVTAWISDEPMIYDKLTPLEYLAFVAGLWSIDADTAEARARELLDWLELARHAHERCEGFSKGMRQKVALAGALVHDPRVIILDEPLTGLDAASARQVKAVLRERVANGGTVIMTTHILEVAERMAAEIEPVQELQRARLGDVGIDAPQAGHEGEVFERRELVVDHRLIRDPRRHALGGDRIGERIDPENRDRAGVGFEQADHHLQGRGLAGAVGAEQCVDCLLYTSPSPRDS